MSHRPDGTHVTRASASLTSALTGCRFYNNSNRILKAIIMLLLQTQRDKLVEK